MSFAQSLSAQWRIAIDPDNSGRAERWFQAMPPDSQPISVPGIVQQVYPQYQGVSWYWLAFEPMRLPGNGERAHLWFEAVEYLAEVWLNGVPVGGHEGSEGAFELALGDALKPGSNLLAVRVLKPGKEAIDGYTLRDIPCRNQIDYADFKPGWSFNIAGIVGTVDLLIVPEVRLTDLFVQPDWETGRIGVSFLATNDTDTAATLDIAVDVSPALPSGGCATLDHVRLVVEALPGAVRVETTLTVLQPRLWHLDDPYLYSVTARTGDTTLFARCGFRDFRVTDGYFVLNSKRLFLRSAHTGNHYPIGVQVPVDKDHLRRDLVMAKSAGFNCIRWIAGAARPEQLDLCDEIGLMVYEETYAAWRFEHTEKLTESYRRSYDEIIARDRNHPSVVIWGLINEMMDGPAFRCAVDYLPRLRELDPTRLVLVQSGRFDCDPTIGSVCNPHSSEWEPAWGVEGPDALTVAAIPHFDNFGGYFDRAGDAHFYPAYPLDDRTRGKLRSFGSESKPVFLSECGVGSAMNVIDEKRGFDLFDVPLDLFDRTFIANMAARFEEDWQRYGMTSVYPFPIDFLRASYLQSSEQRRLLFDLIRANPLICGYSITGLLDHALTGEGLWSFWRRWKTGMPEVLEDGWAPLRWCLFASPLHGYSGEPIELEAVLANEGLLSVGQYDAVARLWSDRTGTVWERRFAFSIDDPLSFAISAFKETVQIELSEGEYRFCVDLDRGAAMGDRIRFFVGERPVDHAPKATIETWGVDQRARTALASCGYECREYSQDTTLGTAKVIVVGDVSLESSEVGQWTSVRRDLESGARVVLASAKPFVASKSPTAVAPWSDLIRARRFSNSLYHPEFVGKRCSIFAGLASGGILDWVYWGQILGDLWFDFQDGDDIAAAGYATGIDIPGGYASGILAGSRRVGDGMLTFTSMRVLEQAGIHPSAGRLLANLVAVSSL